MILPRFSVRRDKVSAYLLDLASEDGGPKAKFFLGRAFRVADAPQFVRALEQHGTDHWPGREVVTRFGRKHVLVGPMACPDGSTPDVLSVWMSSPDGAEASLITAYPGP